MVRLVSPVEALLDERAKHVVLLVDAVEERTNVTSRVENTPGKRGKLFGGHHIFTSTSRSPAEPVVDPLPHSAGHSSAQLRRTREIIGRRSRNCRPMGGHWSYGPPQW